MSKKIRLGYDILSKRAIETESGINIDEALKGKVSVQKVAGTGADSHPDVERPNTQVIYLVKSASSGSSETFKQWMWTQPADAEGYWECVADNTDMDNVENLLSNVECVYIDPTNGDDTKDGFTRNTAVKYLKRAAELYVEKFGGSTVIAKVISTSCPTNYQDSEQWIDPSNSSNLFLDEIDGVDSVILFNDGGISISNTDYQTDPSVTGRSANPQYKLTITSYRSIAIISSINPLLNWIEATSTTGDIHITGSYTQDLIKLKLVCPTGTLKNDIGPRYNAMLDSDTEYYFDALFFISGSQIAGKDATLISRNTRTDGYNPDSLKHANNFPQFYLAGNLHIQSSGSIRETNDSYATSYVGGNVTIESTGANPGSLCLWDIQGHCSDGTGSRDIGNPEIMSYPDIDIKWNGDIYFGYIIGSFSQRSRTIARRFKAACKKLAFFANCDIFSRSDIILDLDDGDLNSYSQTAHLYADGTVKITAQTAVKDNQKIHADNVEIVAGGVPEYKPVTREMGPGLAFSDKNRTVIADLNARITNAIEFFVGSATTFTVSTSDARYAIKCSGDFSDYGSAYQNGNATVSLDVGGSATLSYQGAMLIKRLVLRSDHAYFTNSGIYVASFDIKCGKIQVQYGSYIYQWYSYGTSGWQIGYKNNGAVYNGGSWSHEFEDRSVVDCESIEFLSKAFSSGWIRPAYLTKSDGSIVKHDIDITVGVLIPYRVDDNSYANGNEYCSLIGQPYQGIPNSAITGTIGDVMIGNGQLVSEFKHDWFMSYSDRSYYEQYTWNGCTISCHFLKEISHNIYIDLNQGSDAYDGLSKETPVRTMKGVNLACNRLLQDPRTNYVFTLHVMSSESGGYDSTSPNTGMQSTLDFYDNIFSQTTDNGLCYNWYAAKYLSDNRDTLLPEGWRVPTSNDFSSLTSVGGSGGVDLKGKEWLGSDKYGLNLMPCGYGVNTYWSDRAYDVTIWSSEEYNSSSAYRLTLNKSVSSSSSSKTQYCPIRLVKNASAEMNTGDTGTVTIGGKTYNTVVINGLIWLTRNLDYRFDGGTFRDGTTGKTITASSTPQYAYYNYYGSGAYTIPFGYCQYLEIVSETPFLSIVIDSLYAGVCKITGFRNIYVVDPRISNLYIDASESIYYTCGFRGKYGHGQSEEYSPGILIANTRTFYGRGFRSASSTYINASESFECRSSGAGFGSSATPYFTGSIQVRSADITVGDTCAFFENMNVVLEAAYRISFNSPPTVKNGTLKLISHGTDSNTYYFQSILSANIIIDAKNAPVNMSYLGYSGGSNPGGTFTVTCREFNCAQTIQNSDVTINASHSINMSNSTISGDSNSKITLVAKDIYAPRIYGGTYQIDCTNLSSPVLVNNTGYNSGTTYVYVDAEYCSGPVFAILNDRPTDYSLEATITDLGGQFVDNRMSSSTSQGTYIKKCKGLVKFYSGNSPDTDLADWRGDIAPNADFELIVLNRTKQLSPGSGITISDIGDSVVIAARNDMPLSTVEIPVVIDANDSTQCTASLVLNKYNIITGLDDVVTDMDIVVPTPTARTLREVGFEFEPVEGTQLENVTFRDANETEFLPIAPDEYAYGCVYQGAVINRCVTLVEYGDPIEPEPQGLVIDGKTYRTVTMPDGNEWMAENLAASSFGGVCYNYGDDDIYGLYYTIDEVANISVPGWHVATADEWIGLVESVDYNYAKLASTDAWGDTGTIHGTDDYGFTFCPYSFAQSYMDQPITWYPIGPVGAIWLSNGNQFGAVQIFTDSNTFTSLEVPDIPSGWVAIQNVRLVKDK